MLDDSEFTTGPKKKICWSSWNASVDDFMESERIAIEAMQEEMEDMGTEIPLLPMMPMESVPRVLHTPLGMYHQESMFKPSDRWDCWIGSTNFSITHGIKDTLSMVDGVEALRVLGRYTFFIGVASLFDFKSVRIDIEKTLCGYTEQELLSNEETQATVDLVKEQLIGNKYWSILVAPTGKVDYVVSDMLDQSYLDGLNQLMELKQRVGGIILRGDHG